jgi:hypothetical protein
MGQLSRKPSRARLTGWTVRGKAISFIAERLTMAKNELKTIVTEVDVIAFIAGIADEKQRADASKIVAMISRLSGHPPKMWGPSIIGFGQYHYRYESGREGDLARIGFSPRKGQTVLYIVDGFARYSDLIAKLGKCKTGKSCIYIKQLSDVDQAVLESLCLESLRYMDEKYPI